LKSRDLKWLENVSVDDLPEPYNEMARIVGIRSAIELAAALGGSMLYFPKLESLKRMIRDKRIRDEYTGTNCRQLAKKYGITERRVRCIVAGVVPRPKKRKNRQKNEQCQISLELF